jgi:hypothetical protein
LYRTLIVKAADWKSGPYLSELAAAELPLDADTAPSMGSKSAAITERRESLEFSISDAVSSSWNLMLTHESLVRSPGRINLRAFASLGLSSSSPSEPSKPIIFAFSCGISLGLIF